MLIQTFKVQRAIEFSSSELVPTRTQIELIADHMDVYKLRREYNILRRLNNEI